jgi:hypothetical protein
MKTDPPIDFSHIKTTMSISAISHICALKRVEIVQELVGTRKVSLVD